MKGYTSMIDGHIDEATKKEDEIKCPCGLRDDMEEDDCERTDCDKCCPLAQDGERKEQK